VHSKITDFFNRQAEGIEKLAMHGLRLLHKYFSKACTEIHVKRLTSFFSAIRGLLACNKLTLVNIGRHITWNAQITKKLNK